MCTVGKNTKVRELSGFGTNQFGTEGQIQLVTLCMVTKTDLTRPVTGAK